MPRDGEGLGAAVGALAPEGKLEDEVSQEDLFAASPLLGREDAGALVPQRARGRPAGAQNKTTQAWRDWLLKHYRSPLLGLADLASADPIALAELLACTRLEAVRLVKDAQAELAPYLHRKQPIAIDAGEDKSLPLIVFDLAGLQRAYPAAAAVVEAELVPVETGEVAGRKSQSAGDQVLSD